MGASDDNLVGIERMSALARNNAGEAGSEPKRFDPAHTTTAPETLENPTLAAVYAYWLAKCDGRTMPARADINPVELREHLGWIMMIEVMDDFADFRYRLIGTKAARYFLTNSTGRTVSETYAPFGAAAADGVKAVYRQAARDKTVVRAEGEASWISDWTEDARNFPYYDSLYLPLSDDGETCNILMAVFTFDYADVVAKNEAMPA